MLGRNPARKSMEIDLAEVSSAFRAAHRKRASRHAVSDRLRPGIFQYDYLGLSSLVADLERLIAAVPAGRATDKGRPLALDLGCGKRTHRELTQQLGLALHQLD